MNSKQYINWAENVLYRLMCSEHYFEMTSNLEGQFWSVVQNSIGESVCVFWCHIFGSKSDDLHYSKFFKSDIEELAGESYSLENVKSRLLKSIDLDEDGYLKFWNEVKIVVTNLLPTKK